MAITPPIIGVDVFLERRKTRLFVGSLRKDKTGFVFTYDDKYLRTRNIFSLGPEFPLTQREFHSRSLFPSLCDRIPSKQNPAYPDYCAATGISVDEKDPLILLTTIGKRGPSSFIFEPEYQRVFSAKDVVEFRQRLQLTSREFAQLFEIPQASLNGLERGRFSGKDLLKRLELIVRFPEVARYFLMLNGKTLSPEKLKTAHLGVQRMSQTKGSSPASQTL